MPRCARGGENDRGRGRGQGDMVEQPCWSRFVSDARRMGSIVGLERSAVGGVVDSLGFPSV